MEIIMNTKKLLFTFSVLIGFNTVFGSNYTIPKDLVKGYSWEIAYAIKDDQNVTAWVEQQNFWQNNDVATKEYLAYTLLPAHIAALKRSLIMNKIAKPFMVVGAYAMNSLAVASGIGSIAFAINLLATRKNLLSNTVECLAGLVGCGLGWCTGEFMHEDAHDVKTDINNSQKAIRYLQAIKQLIEDDLRKNVLQAKEIATA